jgi:hypothetical protein
LGGRERGGVVSGGADRHALLGCNALQRRPLAHQKNREKHVQRNRNALQRTGLEKGFCNCVALRLRCACVALRCSCVAARFGGNFLTEMALRKRRRKRKGAWENEGGNGEARGGKKRGKCFGDPSSGRCFWEPLGTQVRAATLGYLWGHKSGRYF